jgi:hypothetical protein
VLMWAGMAIVVCGLAAGLRSGDRPREERGAARVVRESRVPAGSESGAA